MRRGAEVRVRITRFWRSTPLVVTALLVLLALLIGWTTPVLGAVVRYRMPLLPFLIMSCLLMLEPQRKETDLS